MLRRFFGTPICLLLACVLGARAEESSPASGNTNLVLVCTLKDARANEQFQRNIQLLGRQREAIVALQKKLETATAEEKKTLQEEIDTRLKRLNEDNKKMSQAYGFSLTRQYVMAVDEASIYVRVPQAKTGKEGSAAKPAERLVKVATVKTEEGNRQFVQNLQKLQAFQAKERSLRAELQQEKNPAKKLELEAQWKKAEADLRRNNELMKKIYGFTADQKTVYSPEKSRIFLRVDSRAAGTAP